MITGRRIIGIVFLAGVALATFSSARASPEGPIDIPKIAREIVIKDKAETWSPAICLGDIVEDGWLKSRCAVDRQTCCQWNLGGDHEKLLTQAEIQRVVSRLDLGGFDLKVRGATQVLVTQTHRELTQAEIKDKLAAAATTKFGGDGSKAAVTALHSPSPIYVALNAESAWDVILPESPADRLTLKIVSTGEGSETLGWVQAGLSLMSEVYVAKKTIRPGDTLKPEEFEIRKADILVAQAAGLTPLRKGQFPDAVRARLSLLAGAPLTTTSIERIPSIRLGDTVTLVLRSDSLRISTKAVAQGTAAVGDMVTVQLSRYNRTFRGRLLEDRTVEVWL